MSDSSENSLAVPGFGKVLDCLGLAAGVTSLLDPSGASTVAVATIPVAAAVFSHLSEREEERAKQRLRLLLENLELRLRGVEPQKSSSPPDLFKEMMLRAIADDDDRKVPFKGAVIEWVVRSSPRPDQSFVRMAMEAVTNLTYPELRSFVTWAKMGYGRVRLQAGLNERVTMVRYNMFGLLSSDNFVDQGSVTTIGEVLIDRCVSEIYEQTQWQNELL